MASSVRALGAELPAAPAAERLSASHRLRRFARRNPTLLAGGVVMVVIVLSGVLAPAWWTGDPLAMRPIDRLQPPSAAHWFGSDNFGRDVYTRTLYGTRVSLVVGASVALASLIIGTALGLVIGFHRRLDTVMMRVMDGLMAIPAILLALALMALMKGSVRNVIIALIIPEIPRVIRVVRASVLSLREHTMVEGARALGARTPRILARYILPALTAPLIVQATYICASAILFEAYLSFLGAAHSVVGQHHGRGQNLRAARVLDHPVPRLVPRPHRPRHQPDRRRPPRPVGRPLTGGRR
jgi:peptide/nickel transport system permease protein